MSPYQTVEWSDNGFESILGSVEITNLAAKHEFIIDCLETERCYNVRIASGNCKGFSDYCYPLMNQSTPSCKCCFVLFIRISTSLIVVYCNF